MLREDLTILQGRTYRRLVRWESSQWQIAPILSITQSAIARVTTLTPHGIPDGWRVAVVGARGMVELNAKEDPPGMEDLRTATVVTTSAIEFNAVSSASFRTFTSGGWLKWRVPRSLAGYIARMAIKDRVGGTVLHELTTENGGIIVDSDEYTIELILTDEATEGFGWARGVYDLEMESPSGDVELLMAGGVCVQKEVTT